MRVKRLLKRKSPRPPPDVRKKNRAQPIQNNPRTPKTPPPPRPATLRTKSRTPRPPSIPRPCAGGQHRTKQRPRGGKNRVSRIQNRESRIQHRESSIEYQESRIEHPPSSIEYQESSIITQNKPNFKIGNINISTAKTKAYPKEQRTMNNERYSKQTQSNPIPARREAPAIRKYAIRRQGPLRGNTRYAIRNTNPIPRWTH